MAGRIDSYWKIFHVRIPARGCREDESGCCAAGAVLSARQEEAVQQAVERARGTFAEVVQGPWTDALPMLASLEWERAHRQLSSPSLASTAAAVQAWMQVACLSAFLPICNKSDLNGG